MKHFGFMFILSLIQLCECYPTSEESSLSDASIPLPESTDPLVREKLECLKLNKMSNNDIRTWYDRVLNPATRSGRVSKPDQVKVWGCLDLDDFLKFGVLPDEYTTTSTTTLAPVTEAWTTSSMRPSTTSNPLTGITREQIFDCLKALGWNERRVKKWYDRVLNPVSRSGRVTLYDQDLVHKCIKADDFLMWGLSPDYTSTTTSTVNSTDFFKLYPANGANQKLIFDCLKDKGWSELRTRQFYNRVLNPVVSRSGLVSLFDQDLLRGCLDIPTPRLPPHTQSQYDSRPPSG